MEITNLVIEYVDDVILVASKEEEVKNVISRLEKCLHKRKLLVNVEKFKVLVIANEEGEEGRWKDKVIEEVREFNYIGITLTKSGSLKGLRKKRLKNASAVIRQVWGLAETNFKNDFKRGSLIPWFWE